MRLAEVLIERGHDVVGLDCGFYREGSLYPFPRRLTQHVTKDIRQIAVEDLAGFDAVVHLAELSNDPLGEHNPKITYEINHQGSVRLAEMAKKAKVPRFVYTSSCSVYGVASKEWVDETSEANPQTAYAECKVLVEKDLAAMADSNFSPTFLRNATAFGPSPRMRFDIVLNNLAGLAWTTKVISMTSDGTPWRPLVHVLDICEAVACSVAAPREAIHSQVFNVGDNSQNYRVRDIAEIVASVMPGCKVTFGASGGDNRSYRVRFDKIHQQLPGFRCARDARTGASELKAIFEQIQMTKETFEYRAFTRLKQLRHLLNSGQIDERFCWK